MWGISDIMNWQNQNTKKIILLSLSFIFGVGVILGAAKMSGLIKISAPQKASDEWLNSLSVVPGENTLARVKKGSVQADDQASIATTTTDIIARKLITEYSLSQRNANTDTMSDTDAQNLASKLAGEVNLSPKKEYSLIDLNISKNKSPAFEEAYRKNINTLIQAHSATQEKESDLSIVATAMDTGNAGILKKLDAKVAIHQKIINDLIALETPAFLAPIHLHLIAGYEMLRSATAGSQSMLSDPAKGIASLSLYRNGIDALLLSVDEYNASRLAN